MLWHGPAGLKAQRLLVMGAGPKAKFDAGVDAENRGRGGAGAEAEGHQATWRSGSKAIWPPKR
jgi:hypothetical protein